MEPNSQDWWDDYFEKHWERNNGRAQTAGFMRVIIDNLPDEVRDYAKKGVIVDWGCALGDGTALLETEFPEADVYGVDSSMVALSKARGLYPGIRFMRDTDCASFGDILITSACLEHFKDPMWVMQSHLGKVSEYYVIFVPWKESPLIGCHFHSFDESSFPVNLRGFDRLSLKVIKTSPGLWKGEMVLVVYQKTKPL